MMRVLIISMLFIGKSYSQNLEDLKIPLGYTKIAETRGDLDKDGIEEVVIAYETKKVDKDSFFVKELYICKIKEGRLKLWKKNTTVLFSKRDSYEDKDNVPSLKITNNTLIIEQTFHGSSRTYDSYKNIFRFQNNDWYLIGSTIVSQYNCLYENTYDINFSTGQTIVKLDNQCCSDVWDCDEKKPDKKFSFKHTFEKTIMDRFTPGEKELKIPKSIDKFTY